eukprot:TRINITY_DN4990_c0_g1_i1.p1 TRINITY_DN4990_c0_g1~~TRINITY_DN4990_c0_g1_i1.p1  ORF type:complete len:491 (-),score=141.73 TRINITY_DN4990_c0_g1_i1:204-1676(-)
MEPLADPKKDRVIKTVKPPPHRPLEAALIWPARLRNKPDWRAIKDHLSKEGRLSKVDLIRLINDAVKIFRSEGNVVQLQDPLTVVGDIHGQYYDLVKIMEIGGNADTTKYLFLGDFVDRGSFSIEVLILLFALKTNYVDTMYFLRGNHECRQMTTFFNFRTECLYKYDQEIYDLFMEAFDCLPLSCIVNGKFIAVHGGLSPELKTIEDVNKLDRFKEPPRHGIFCDLLWSDPVDNDDGICENLYRSNDVRGCSYFYGTDAVNTFLDRNGLLSVIRAHEAQIEGYKMHRWNGNSEFPVVITVFSAPNYCDVYNNKGAVIKFENNTLNIQQFNYSPHPYLLPNFMDIFTWSIPFVAEKVTELLFSLVKPKDGQDISDDDEDINDPDIKKTLDKIGGGPQTQGKSEILRNKIKFVSRMVKMNRTLRLENETLVQLKGMCPDNKIPKGLLIEGSQAIQGALDLFQTAKKADIVNEKRPEVPFFDKKPSSLVKKP